MSKKKTVSSMTVREIADKLKRSPTRIRQLIKLGRIPATKDGWSYKVAAEDLEGFSLRPPGRPSLTEETDKEASIAKEGRPRSRGNRRKAVKSS